MEAKELMVGDWVSVSDTQMQVACITKVGFRHENGGVYFHSYEKVKPIPLTAEILEKNGFRKYNEYEYRLEYPEMIVSISEEPTTFYLYIESMAYTLTIEMCIDYVHELQHALRLCGIEREIEI